MSSEVAESIFGDASITAILSPQRKARLSNESTTVLAQMAVSASPRAPASAKFASANRCLEKFSEQIFLITKARSVADAVPANTIKMSANKQVVRVQFRIGKIIFSVF
jgi:hypothetical protein